MSKFEFDKIDELQRERDVEGEIGVWLRVTDELFFHVLCQSDANPRYRLNGPKKLREIRRQANAGATPQQIDVLWAEWFTDCLIIGWRGPTMGYKPATETEPEVPGKPVPFSREACVAFLIAHPRMIKILETYTNDETNFRRSKAGDLVEEAGE